MYNAGLRGISGTIVYFDRSENYWTHKEQFKLVSEICGVVRGQKNTGNPMCQAAIYKYRAIELLDWCSGGQLLEFARNLV